MNPTRSLRNVATAAFFGSLIVAAEPKVQARSCGAVAQCAGYGLTSYAAVLDCTFYCASGNQWEYYCYDACWNMCGEYPTSGSCGWTTYVYGEWISYLGCGCGV